MLSRILLTAGALALLQSAAPMLAEATCSGEQCALSPNSSVRYQFGNALPVPFAAQIFEGPPVTGQVNATNDANGAIKPAPYTGGGGGGGIITAGSVAPQSIMMPAAQLTWMGPTFNIPLFGAIPQFFSIQTRLNVQFPQNAVTFSAGGRSGASTATYCPGAPFPGGTLGTPGCLGPNTTASGGPTAYGAIMTYTRTVNQFGGAAVNNVLSEDVQLAVNVGGVTALPCTMCVFGRQPIVVGSQFGIGGSWASTVTRMAATASPGFFIGSVNAAGLITNVIGPTPSSNPLAGQGAQSTGGPWTTGQVSVSAPGNVPPEAYVFTGSDQRTPSGEGTISLVSGAVNNRVVQGPGANRGWLTLRVPEPGFGLGLMAGLGMLGAMGRRRRA
ncbi:MAG: hypothetical protein CL908_26100 [Deltaproteobacteria bacterium]|nr:hypothetical protein [Deltaproteobacteria bacterium]